MADEYKVITPSVVKLLVTSNINSFTSERRFPKNITISELKGKIELLTGGSANCMVLQLFSRDDKYITDINDNEAILGSYPVDDGMRIHIIDKSIKTGEFEDTSKVEKFQLSDDEYAKKKDSVRSFLLQNKLGKYADDKSAEDDKDHLKEEESLARAISINSRCEVQIPGQMVRRGTVMFVGQVHFKSGWWVGIKYDEPYGKNDGSIDGKRYFECLPKYGGFVKPQNVTVGDFPEESLEDEMEEI